MSPDDLGVLLPQSSDEIVETALTAEELGYRSIWLGELWGTSAVATLAEIAVRTEDVRLGSAVLNVFSRSPAVLAMTARTLSEQTGGRFTLGLGTSTRKVVEDLHGAAWEDPNPVRRAHEAVELTRAFLAGEGRVEYHGEVFDVSDFPSLGVEVPIYGAALGEANRRVVARLCDGWIPHNVPYADLPEAFAYVAEHAESAGRDPDDVVVAPYVVAAVHDDPAVARDAVREHVAYYVGNGEGYRRAVAGRFPDAARRVAELWQRGDRGRAAGAVTDEMVAALGVAGAPEEARRQLREVVEMDVVDRPMLTVPATAFEALGRRTVEELAPGRL